MLHYRSPWGIGDVHPYYKDGELYLFYLRPNGIVRCDACFEDPQKVVCTYGSLSRTTDYIHWQMVPTDEVVLNIVKGDDFYYCCRGTQAVSFIESRNLVHWQPSKAFRLKQDARLFPAGARDFACFWDDDLSGMRVTMNAYMTNEHKSIGHGMECCVGISGVLNTAGDETPAQKVLLPIDNSCKDLWHSQEPECNQMIRIGSRWYLIASMARRTVHWVGAPSYWIGEENTPIDAQNWGAKQEHILESEDLCAAQVADNNGRFYLFGWIPMNYSGQEWGGHLNLPHEVYPLAGGLLGVRLDADFAKRIKGKTTFHPVDGLIEYNGGVRLQSWPSDPCFGLLLILKPGSGYTAAVMLDEATGLTVLLERPQQRMRVVRVEKEHVAFTYSSLFIPAEEWLNDMNLHVIADEDIVEAFLNDRYALCARVDKPYGPGTTSVWVDGTIRVAALETYTFCVKI